jgi:hypothetical protein
MRRRKGEFNAKIVHAANLATVASAEVALGAKLQQSLRAGSAEPHSFMAARANIRVSLAATFWERAATLP